MLGVWALALTAYFFQVPFTFISSLIVPLLAVFLILNILINFDLKTDWLYMALVIYLLISAILSLFNGVPIQKIIRFALILSMIPLFASIKMKEKKLFQQIFLFLSSIKSLYIIFYAIRLYSAYYLMTESYMDLRFEFMNNGFGDIYILSGIPKVQILGSGILPVAFMLSCCNNRIKHSKLYGCIIFLGIILAGNFAYFLALLFFGAYMLYKMFRKKYKNNWIQFLKIIICLFIPVVLIAVVYYIYNQIQIKSTVSNAVRIEQMNLLLSGNWFIGNGLGSSVDYVGDFRTYTDDNIYFELQSLYVFYQIGIVGIALFFFSLFVRFYNINKDSIVIFLIYLIYSFWNPYCFDTTEMMTIALLMNVNYESKIDAILNGFYRKD